MSAAVRRRGRSALGVVVAAVALLTPLHAVAWAAFANVVQATGSSFAAYTVASPTGIHCSGLVSLLSSKILWNAVAPPAGQSTDYVVTAPGGGTTTTAVASYTLPSVTLVTGQYAVQARISSGWLSPPATITVSLGVLGLYTCSVP